MKSNTGLLFVLPALIVLFMLIAYPVAYTGVLSVTDEQGAFTGMKNFADVLRPRVTTQALWNTLWWVGGSIVFQVILGVASAILLVAKRASLKTQLPFGPYMMLGALVGLVWGESLSGWYTSR